MLNGICGTLDMHAVISDVEYVNITSNTNISVDGNHFVCVESNFKIKINNISGFFKNTFCFKGLVSP